MPLCFMGNVKMLRNALFEKKYFRKWGNTRRSSEIEGTPDVQKKWGGVWNCRRKWGGDSCTAKGRTKKGNPLRVFFVSSLKFNFVSTQEKIMTLVYPSALWYTFVHPSTLWYTLVQPCTLWYTLIHHSTLWYSLVQPSTLWYTLIYPSIIWYTLVHSGTLWFTLEYSGTLW